MPFLLNITMQKRKPSRISNFPYGDYRKPVCVTFNVIDQICVLIAFSILHSLYNAEKMKFFIKDLVKFTEEIFNGKLRFLCIDRRRILSNEITNFICVQILLNRRNSLKNYNTTLKCKRKKIVAQKKRYHSFFHMRRNKFHKIELKTIL